jgi:hypothetical protein
MSSHSKLVDFFLSLQDPEALKRFQADPEGALGAAGLTDAEKAAVRSQDQKALRSLIGSENDTLKFIFPDVTSE